MSDSETVLYMVSAMCPSCDTEVNHVEERGTPLGLMRNVFIRKDYCPYCGATVINEWGLQEEAEIERVEPTDPAEVER